MSHLVRWSERGCSMVFVTILVISGNLFASSARANTTWTVTVSVVVTQGTANDVPTYNISSIPANAPNCAGANPIGDPTQGDIQICPGDAIYWTFVTKGQKGWMTVHQKDGILKDSQSNSEYWFSKQEKDTTNPGGATQTTLPDNIYNYCVAVHDDNGSSTHLYTHDPKIIIGQGRQTVLFNDVKHYCNQLTASFTDEIRAKEAKKTCEEAEQKLERLLPHK